MATKRVTLNAIQMQSGTDKTAFVTWRFSDGTKSGHDHTEKYEYEWDYSVNAKWFSGSSGSSNANIFTCTYSIPDNADVIRVRVKPVSKTYRPKNAKQDKKYYESAWPKIKSGKTTTTYRTKTINSTKVPEDISTPSISISKCNLTVSVDSYDTKTTGAQFSVIMDNSKEVYNKVINLSRNHASTVVQVDAGHSYKVRARGYNSNAKLYGQWSNYSSEEYSSPTAPKNVVAKAVSSTQIDVTWDAVSNATEYEIEYTTDSSYFDTNLERVQSQTITSGTTFRMTQMEDTGKTYFFRVRAVANSDDPSEWSAIKSTTVGTVPDAPTTWSMTTTASVGDTLYLYWTHNSADGSKATYSELEVLVGGTKLPIAPIKNDKKTEDDTGTYNYTIDTSKYQITPEQGDPYNPFTFGSKLKWRVRTKGVVNDGADNGYGPWSVQREIDIYAPPTVNVDLGKKFYWLWDSLNLVTGDINNTAGEIEPLEDDTMTAFPLWIEMNSGPAMQTPIGYYVTITSDPEGEEYDDMSVTGENIHVIPGQEVFSRYYPSDSHSLTVSVNAFDVNLHDGIAYIVHVAVSMDSGLTAEATKKFTVFWDESTEFEPGALLTIDTDSLGMMIEPSCIVTPSEEEEEDEEPAEEVYAENVTMSVYRVDANGEFIEIMSGLNNEPGLAIFDPHPTFGMAIYRIVGVSNDTGAIVFEDVTEPVNETSIVIQWDEQWSQFSEDEDAAVTINRPWQGTMLKLPYNVDISDSNDVDVEFAEYIGRAHPVSYYGTQKGSKSSWKADIPTADTETIGLLRRLANHMGDVYVREPYGTGYWAQVKVQFELKHNTVITPVSLEVTRVEGGI